MKYLKIYLLSFFLLINYLKANSSDNINDIKSLLEGRFELVYWEQDNLKFNYPKVAGTLVVKNNLKNTTGIITDGDLKRISNMNKDFKSLKIKKVMKRKPLSVDKNMLAVEALSIMNNKKITSLCVHQNKNKKKQLVLSIYTTFWMQT